MNLHAHPETVRIKVDVTDDNPEGVVIINKSDFVEGMVDADAPEVAPASTTGLTGSSDPVLPATEGEKKPWNN
jgi:hypothetical protein